MRCIECGCDLSESEIFDGDDICDPCKYEMEYDDEFDDDFKEPNNGR